MAVIVDSFDALYRGALFALLFCLLCVTSAAQGAERLNTQQAVDWLRAHDFETLEKHLDRLYQEVKEKPELEYRMEWTYEALENSYKKEREAVLLWRRAKPDSTAARIVDAAQLTSIGWDYRGTGFSNTISESNYRKFTEHLDQARVLLEEAMQKTPDHPALYFFYVNAVCPRGCPADIVTILDDKVPHAYFARRRLLNYMQPKWHGSLKIIRTYQHELSRKLADNPHWKPLLAYDQLALCTLYGGDKRYDQAVPHCLKALAAGVDDLYVSDAAYTLVQADRFESLYKHVNVFRQQFPSDIADNIARRIADRIARRTYDLTQAGQYDVSQQALDYALQLAPDLASVYVEKGRLSYEQNGDIDAAIADLRHAITLRPGHFYAYEVLTWIMNKENRLPEIIPDLQRYVQEKPQDKRGYYQLSRAYFAARDVQATWDNASRACELQHEQACAWQKSAVNSRAFRNMKPAAGTEPEPVQVAEITSTVSTLTADLLHLLSQKDFVQLNARLDALHQQYRQSPEKEYQLYHAYQALLASTGARPAVLRDWIRQMPEAPAPLIIASGRLFNDILQGRARPGRFSTALDYLEKARAMAPDHPVAALFMVQQQCLSSPDSCDTTLLPLLNQEAPQAYYARRAILKHITQGGATQQWKIEAFIHTLDEKPGQNNPALQALRGFGDYQTCNRLGKQKGERHHAITACQRALQAGLDEGYVYRLATLMLEAKKAEAAIETVQRLFSARPSDYWRGQFTPLARKAAEQGADDRRAGKASDAVNAYTLALLIDPDDAETRLIRIKLLNNLNQFTQAEQDARVLLKLQPTHFEAIQQLDHALLRQGRVAEIIPLWETYIEHHPDNAQAYYELGGTYFQLKDNEKAMYYAALACDHKLAEACRRAGRPVPDR